MVQTKRHQPMASSMEWSKVIRSALLHGQATVSMEDESTAVRENGCCLHICEWNMFSKRNVVD